MREKVLLAAALIAGALGFQSVRAAEVAEQQVELPAVAAGDAAAAAREESRIHKVIGDALSLVGIRYRRGGGDAETGFDCSGFVGYVFRETLGLALPRTSGEISRAGESVEKDELQPGDLVFFNTMRRAFSHVGIYLGDNQFVHAPRTGRAVRVEDMRSRYWSKRYNGARRIEDK